MNQIPSIILPRVWASGLELEAVTDALEHTSVEFQANNLMLASVHVTVVEVVAAGVPGPLLAWIELSPYPTTVNGNFWAAVDGGGGDLPPDFPLTIIGTGVNGTRHSFFLEWGLTAQYARLVVQTPVPVAGATWTVQAVVSGVNV